MLNTKVSYLETKQPVTRNKPISFRKHFLDYNSLSVCVPDQALHTSGPDMKYKMPIC
jgi:hypothetical protein